MGFYSLKDHMELFARYRLCILDYEGGVESLLLFLLMADP